MLKHPIFKAFWDFPWPKTRHHGLKTAKNTCLSIPSGLAITLEKMIFFAPGTLVDPSLAPTLLPPTVLPSGRTK